MRKAELVAQNPPIFYYIRALDLLVIQGFLLGVWKRYGERESFFYCESLSQ
ncbi:hypothetical protein GOP47_0010063, partial [Adiantum capillus-veneris]